MHCLSSKCVLGFPSSLPSLLFFDVYIFFENMVSNGSIIYDIMIYITVSLLQNIQHISIFNGTVIINNNEINAYGAWALFLFALLGQIFHQLA